jgi:hypothetical protein
MHSNIQLRQFGDARLALQFFAQRSKDNANATTKLTERPLQLVCAQHNREKKRQESAEWPT